MIGRGHVAERRPGDERVARRDAELGHEHQRPRDEGAVADQSALGQAGRAAGVEDDEAVLRAPRRPAARAASARGEAALVVLAERDRGAGSRHRARRRPRPAPRATSSTRGAASRRQCSSSGRARRQFCAATIAPSLAAASSTSTQAVPLRARIAMRSPRVTPSCGKHLCETVDAIVELAESDLPLALDHRDRVAIGPCPGAEQRAERARRRPRRQRLRREPSPAGLTAAPSGYLAAIAVPVAWRRRGMTSLGHQRHRALPERLVVPVEPGQHHRAERADLLAHREQLLGHGLGAAGDHDVVDRPVDRQLRVVELVEPLHDLRDAGLLHQRAEVVEVVAHRVVGPRQIGLGLGVGLGHQDGATDVPALAVGLGAGLDAALAEALPVGRDARRRDEVGADRLPAAPGRLLDEERVGAHAGDRDRRVRLLVGPRHVAEPELRHVPLALADLPELALDVVGRLAAPELEDDVDRFERHLAAHHRVLEMEQLEVRRQPARPDAHQEAAVGQMVEHRGEARDHGRMLLRQVEHAGAQADLPGQRDRLGEEGQGRGDRLGHRAEMLADPDVVEAQLVGEDDRLEVLLEHLVVVPRRRVQRHHEQAESHLSPPWPVIWSRSRAGPAGLSRSRWQCPASPRRGAANRASGAAA